MTSDEMRQFLAEARHRLQSTVDGIAPDLLSRRPAPQKWSPLEILEHLALAEEWYVVLVSGLVTEGRSRGLEYKEGQPRNTDAVAALATQIDVQKPYPAPDFLHPTGQVALPILLERLSRSRQALVDLLPALDELDTDQLMFAHPRGDFELNAYQWVHLSGLHDRKHARQIRQALSMAS